MGYTRRIYEKYSILELDFSSGLVHPNDLKKAMIIHINNLLEPVREYFNNNKQAKNLAKLVKAIVNEHGSNHKKDIELILQYTNEVLVIFYMVKLLPQNKMHRKWS